MPHFPRAQVLDRDGLTTGLSDVSRLELRTTSLDDIARGAIPARGGVIVTWQPSNDDPYPEALVVRDEDYRDTIAWLGSYFNGLAPISQWCRVWPQSEFESLFQYQKTPTLGRSLGSWIGLIVSEVAAQGGHSLSLREVPGNAALATASFAAARSGAVWGKKANLRQIAHSYDELSAKLRDNARPIAAASFLPIWYAISGDYLWSGVESERRSLEPFRDLFEYIQSSERSDDDVVQGAVNLATDHFDLPLIDACARGPQSDRVAALDHLAARLQQGPQSPAIAALLGFAASLIEPGVAVLPELLRRFTPKMPLAPLWLGAFAGAWSPARVLADNQGLGRMISKSVLAEPDLEGRPRCDIAYQELARWLGGGGASRIVLRGMAGRTLNVELAPGVNALFGAARLETRSDVGISGPSAQHAVVSGRARAAQGSGAVTLDAVMRALSDLARRVEQLEVRPPVQPDLLESNTGTQARGKSSKARKQ